MGVVLKSLYGTRRAAANWEKHWQGVLKAAGFSIGVFSPALAHHDEKDATVFVHWDGFVALGEPKTLERYKAMIAHRRWASAWKIPTASGEQRPSDCRFKVSAAARGAPSDCRFKFLAAARGAPILLDFDNKNDIFV